MIQDLHNQIFNLHRGFSLLGGGRGQTICLEYRRDIKTLPLLILWHLPQYGRKGRSLQKKSCWIFKCTIEFGTEETHRANNSEANGLKPFSAII